MLKSKRICFIETVYFGTVSPLDETVKICIDDRPCGHYIKVSNPFEDRWRSFEEMKNYHLEIIKCIEEIENIYKEKDETN